tara:strand:+ start:12512 stop:13108 length:597 start_codon:yes stop_codon:yes gene_type:complete
VIKHLFFLLLITLTIPSLAMAQQAEEKSEYRYAPDKCGFELTLPEAPYTVKKCEKDNGKDCYTLSTFTQVYSMNTSLRMDITCSPISKTIAQRYTDDIMKQTLEAMTDKSLIKIGETFSRSTDRYKQATLLGEGLQGRTPTLFMAQLWIDESSAFAVKAEIVGEALTEADTVFSEILRSIKPIDLTEENDQAAADAEE